MTKVAGSVRFGGREQSISGQIELDEYQRGETRGWGGSFRLPAGSYLEPGTKGELELEDGRSGEFLVKAVTALGTHTSVEFQGTGPLTRRTS